MTIMNQKAMKQRIATDVHVRLNCTLITINIFIKQKTPKLNAASIDKIGIKICYCFNFGQKFHYLVVVDSV